jgi:hypothetical protein
VAYDITQLKSDLEGITHGTTLNQIRNVDGAINRAGRQLLLDIDPQETIRIAPISNPIYDRIYDYPAPPDLKGNKVIDIRPQSERHLRDNYLQLYSKDFDIGKNAFFSKSDFNVNFNTALKTLRINNPSLNPRVLVDVLDEIGTWTVQNAAINLSKDEVNFVAGNASLRFKAGGGTSSLRNVALGPFDFTDQENQGTFLFFVYLEDAANVVSINLFWGNNLANGYSRTTTVTQTGTAFQNGWNLIALPWFGASILGVPIPTGITTFQINITHAGVQNMKVDNLVLNMGRVMEIVYYSKFLFRNPTTGAFQETVLTDSDLINLDTETVNLLTYQVVLQAVQQQAGADAGFDIPYFRKLYEEGVAKYKMMYKSQVQKPTVTYYRQPKQSPPRFFNRRT